MDVISFARGAPSPELIPARLLAECAAAAAEREGAAVFGYGVAGGYGPLREWVAERHGVSPGRVVLTVGGLLGFVLFTGALLERRPGRVLVEWPSYDRTLKIVAGSGAPWSASHAGLRDSRFRLAVHGQAAGRVATRRVLARSAVQIRRCGSDVKMGKCQKR